MSTAAPAIATTDRVRTRPPTCELTADDMFESFTGFDEIAVRKAFEGRTITDLTKVDPLQFVRALVFVHQRRLGLKDREAYDAAQALSLAEVDDYFSEDLEPTPGDPVTDQGKGDTRSESEPPS